jgi:hypothetical protein
MAASMTFGGCSGMGAYSVDIVSVGFFILELTVYAVTLEHTAYSPRTPGARWGNRAISF